MGTERGSTLNDYRPAAIVARERGWGVGTRLVGDEGYGPTTIEITAIGEKAVLAKRITCSVSRFYKGETSWTFGCRDWQPAAAAVGEHPDQEDAP